MKENDFILLVFKRLSGDITPAETLLLNDWISQSPDNERIANEYSLIWEKSGNYQKQFSPNLEADFAKVQARIRIEELPTIKVSFFSTTLLRVAAALALLVLSVWGYSTIGGSQYYDSMASAQQVDKQLLSLSDGTQVWLRQGSSLEYVKSFDGKKTRQVKLNGEAYFEVAHDPSHPFKVELEKGGAVEVLGTQFSVNQTENTTTVLVRSGKVQYTLENGIKSPVLLANQAAVFDREAGTLRVLNKTSLNELSWQTGGLEFVNTPLSQVVLDLEKFYNIKISMPNKAMADCPHTALLSNQTLQNVFEGLAVAYQFKLNTVGSGEYVLSGGQCR